VQGEDLKQAFIENDPKHSKGFLASLGGLFSTHPPIDKRIAILERGL
jgi:heat shock protein HtpX